MRFIEIVRPYAELLFFIAGVGLFIISAYGLRQVRLLKEDMRTRSLRAAREKAIEATSYYLNEFVPQYNKVWTRWQKAGLGSYEGRVDSDFDFDSLPSDVRERGLKRFKMFIGSNAFNAMELVASYFTTGVADEEVGFHIIGRSYCGTVGSNYDVLAICHSTEGSAKAKSRFYMPIIELYRTWSARLSKDELTAARAELDKNIAAISEGSLEQIHQKI